MEDDLNKNGRCHNKKRVDQSSTQIDENVTNQIDRLNPFFLVQLYTFRCVFLTTCNIEYVSSSPGNNKSGIH
jgi:hypothetical protein